MPTDVTIRASSLPELFDCPARWASKAIYGKTTPSSSNAQLGTAVHASTALFDQKYLEGVGISVDDAASAAVDAIHKPERDVDWGDYKPAEVEKIAVSLHRKYCNKIAPNQKYKAVEVKVEALKITDLGITLTGTTDRIRQTDGGFGISDIKTGKNRVLKDGSISTKGHTYQLGVYELLAEQGSGLPIRKPAQVVGLNVAKTDTAQRVGTANVFGAREVLLGNEYTPGILKTASEIIKSGNFWGNPKSMMCHKKYCPVYNSCNYRK